MDKPTADSLLVGRYIKHNYPSTTLDLIKGLVETFRKSGYPHEPNAVILPKGIELTDDARKYLEEQGIEHNG